MTIAFTGLTSGSDSTNNPSTTASVNPTSGAQVFAAVLSALNGGSTSATQIDTVTISGAGLTWATVGTVNYGVRRRLTVFRGSGTPSSGTLTITTNNTGGSTMEEHMWSIVEATGVDGSTPIGTAYSNTSTYAAQPLLITVSETPDAGDFVFAAFGIGDAAASGTINSELSNEIHKEGGGTDCRTVLTAYDSSPDSTPVPGITWTGSNDAGGIAFIINVGGASQSNAPRAVHHMRQQGMA